MEEPTEKPQRRARDSRRWTPLERQSLADVWPDRAWTLPLLAEAFRRSQKAISNQSMRQGLPPRGPGPKPRAPKPPPDPPRLCETMRLANARDLVRRGVRVGEAIAYCRLTAIEADALRQGSAR